MMTTISTKSSGMENLLNRSMPDFTPAETMAAQPPRKSVWQNSARPGLETNSPKAELTEPSSAAWKPRVSACQR